MAGVVHRAGLGSDGMFLSSAAALERAGSRTWTRSAAPRGTSRIAHAVEFSKTACAPGAGTPLLMRARRLWEAFRAGPTSIALSASPDQGGRGAPAARRTEPRQCSDRSDGRHPAG